MIYEGQQNKYKTSMNIDLIIHVFTHTVYNTQRNIIEQLIQGQCKQLGIHEETTFKDSIRALILYTQYTWTAIL